jgi:hypothetical protein
MWFSRRAIGLHVTVLVVVPAFLALGWWQFDRATSGNDLSWAYTFEWPVFAAYAVFMWWKLLHEWPGREERAPHGPAPRVGSALPDRVVPPPGPDLAAHAVDRHPDEADEDEEDEELRAYNEYLAALNASGRRKSW